MTKIISIVGPTAVGKTQFALQVAKRLLESSIVTGVDIISADSRQVYKNLEIVSGVDVPEGFVQKTLSDWLELNTYFEKEHIRIFGILLLSPIEAWSVSQFQDYAQRVIALSQQENRAVIVVGGTGLYQQQLFTRDPQLHVSPNMDVRQKAETLLVKELQDWLGQLDSARFKQMNASDQQNPRRLVRAIEIALARSSQQSIDTGLTGEEMLPLFSIGLIDSIEHIEERIARRVDDRLQQGAVAEVAALVAEYGDLKAPVFSATGFKPLGLLANGEISESECRELWITQERQYAKRQLTWWKKQPEVKWFQITDSEWQTRALDTIETWYI